MRARSKVLIVAAVAVPMVLGGAGTAYATHYQDRALPGSTVGGVPVAGMTRAEVADTVRTRAADVTVTVSAAGSTRSAHLADLGYAVDVDATVAAVFADRSWSTYASSLVSPRGTEAVVDTDPATVDAVVADLVGRADKLGRDAEVTLDAAKRSFVVEPAVTGQTVVPTTFQDVVAAAARHLRSATATVEFEDVTPHVTTAEAQEVAAAANDLVRHPVALSDGTDEYRASTRTKASWVTLPTGAEAPGAPTLDATKVADWVESIAAKADAEPVTGLRYVTADGTVRRVVSQKQDGRSVSNAADLSSAAVAALTAGKGYSGRFAYDVVPATWTDRRIAAGAENLPYPAADGEKWIDVDLTKHTMTAYVGASPVYGPVAMVNGAAETPTVAGTFHIYQKNALMTMRGRNADGSDYETPDVPWTSFFYAGYALHGAYWRDTFGYAASHGCVNLPVDVAKWVYDFAPVGTAVVTHT